MVRDRTIQAIRHRLGLPAEGDPPALEAEWERFRRQPGADAQLGAVARALAEQLQEAAAARLGLATREPPGAYDGLWRRWVEWVRENPSKWMPSIAGRIGQGLGLATATPPATSAPMGAAKAPVGVANAPTPAPKPEVRSPDLPMVVASPPPPPPPPVNPALLWKYRPLPEGPDPHKESEARALESEGGFRLLGARVRGKKHKHDGTHCDDWFEFARAGGWTIVAVADGAGSKKFSRVGAKAACRAATSFLGQRLADCSLADRADLEHWTRDLVGGRAPGRGYEAPDLRQIYESLHLAMKTAYDAVQEELRLRVENLECREFLGRPIELNDLACTLLLAVRAVVPIDGKQRDLVLSCQVGDGMIAAIGRQGNLFLLGEADTGAYSGETEFLISPKQMSDEVLDRKTFATFNELQALLVMSDGVADDYFPNDPEVLRLWGDLLVNRLLDVTAPEDKAANDQAEELVYYTTPGYLVEPDGTREVLLRSAAKYAERLGLPWDAVARDPAKLWAAGRGGSLLDGNSPERLRLWLDAYQVRGSFDDRTLVVLHRESLP